MGHVLSTLRSILTPDTGERVHFHRGPSGSPAVCDDPRCERPALTVD